MSEELEALEKELSRLNSLRDGIVGLQQDIVGIDPFNINSCKALLALSESVQAMLTLENQIYAAKQNVNHQKWLESFEIKEL
jgi:hypothetical protein